MSEKTRQFACFMISQSNKNKSYEELSGMYSCLSEDELKIVNAKDFFFHLSKLLFEDDHPNADEFREFSVTVALGGEEDGECDQYVSFIERLAIDPRSELNFSID